MWQILYVIAFALLAVLAIANLIKNLMVFAQNGTRSQARANPPQPGPSPHPELLDETGQVIREPLLVMRSISVKDVREQLDALYHQGSNSAEGPEEGTPLPEE
ncbi:MAG: DUF2973 domain-containing protein [Cyanobacteria bacterium REEB459]|nr:DUF2973 domain-containing protein [Cyanobacteria bacterium REEB459]